MLYHTSRIFVITDMAAVFKTDNQTANGSALDRAAICVSAVCMVQCLILPLLIVFSPLVSLGFFGDELFHQLLLVLIVPVSLIAFYLGFRTHRNRQMLVPGMAGLVIIILAAVLEESTGALATALLTSLGGVLLITGHWLNLRRRRQLCMRPNR